MQNNISEEEPAAYFQRVYKLKRLDASKNEHAYMRLMECGSTINMDDYMVLVGRAKKVEARRESVKVCKCESEYIRGIEDGKIIAEHGSVNWQT